MVVAASKKDETVTTPLKKSLFRNYHPLFLLFFYSGITCHRYGKTGQPPQKVSTHCMEHRVSIFWRKKCNFGKNSCFLYGNSKGYPTKIRAYTDLSVILIFLRGFLNCTNFLFFCPMWARQVVAAHDHRRGMLLNHQGYGRFRFHNFTQELLDDILFEAFI